MSNTAAAEALDASSGEGTEVEYNRSDVEQEEPKKINHPLKLDAYGFITNVDSNGRVTEIKPGVKKSRPMTVAESERKERREKKWRGQLASWNSTTMNTKRKNKKFIKRLRKGIPDSMRGRVWSLLSGGIKKPGYYEGIVKKTSDAMLSSCKKLIDEASAKRPFQQKTRATKSLKWIQIQRRIIYIRKFSQPSRTRLNVIFTVHFPDTISFMRQSAPTALLLRSLTMR
jgi:hypothetical protein